MIFLVYSLDSFLTFQVYYSGKCVLGEFYRFVSDAMIVRWANGFIMSVAREDMICVELCIHMHAHKTVCVIV